MKYPGYYEESKKTNDKNRFRASHFERTEDGGIYVLLVMSLRWIR